MVIRRGGISSLVKVLDVIYAVLGFVLGAFLTFFSSLPEASASAGAIFALFLVSKP